MKTTAGLGAIAHLGFALLAGGASAQTVLTDGQAVGGQALTRTLDHGVIIDRYECVLFTAPAATRWKLEVTGSAFIRLSHDCRPRGGAIYSASGRDLDFMAGGGSYFVVVGRTDITSQGATNGPWSILARSLPGTGGRRLEPGFTFIAGPPGVASRSGGDEMRTPGDLFSDCPTCPRMAVLPPGSFMMGSPDEEEGREVSEGPRHVVSIASAFAVGMTEVTFEEYDACSADGACAVMGDGGWGRGRRPVIGVSWLDAQRYVGWLSQKTGKKYFLPSEAEWEYAARAGTDTPWNTGSAIIAADANILGQFSRPAPVGSYAANAFGLHDLHGNVMEWTLDCMGMGYLGSPSDGSAATDGNCEGETVARGGSFKSSPYEARSSARTALPRATVSDAVGFRVTRGL